MQIDIYFPQITTSSRSDPDTHRSSSRLETSATCLLQCLHPQRMKNLKEICCRRNLDDSSEFLPLDGTEAMEPNPSRAHSSGFTHEGRGKVRMHPKQSDLSQPHPFYLTVYIRNFTQMKSSTQDFDLSDLNTIAEKIGKEKCEGMIIINKKSYIYILTVLPLSYICVLHPGITILQNSRVLRELCEMSNCFMVMKTKWTCKIKDYGRLLAQCTLSGHASKRKGKGIQSCQLQNVGCITEVRTVPIRFFFGSEYRV